MYVDETWREGWYGRVGVPGEMRSRAEFGSCGLGVDGQSKGWRLASCFPRRGVLRWFGRCMPRPRGCFWLSVVIVGRSTGVLGTLFLVVSDVSFEFGDELRSLKCLIEKF